MNQKIFVIDNFIKSPLGYYDKIDSGICTRGLESVDNPLDLEKLEKIYPEKVVFNKISDALRSRVTILDSSNNQLKEGTNTPICCHLKSDYIGVLYLSLPLSNWGEFGMKFYSHKETGLDSYPTQEQIQKYNITNIGKTFCQDLKNWKEYGSIPVKHNRMVLFRSNLWHSYGNGFGSDLNTSMLYKKIIIKNG